MLRKIKPIAERLWAKVDVRGPDECWPWLGATRKGATPHGVIGAGRGGEGNRYTHVVAYELAHGPVPEGKELRHTCDFGLCCNERHLVTGTHAENMADMSKRGRSPRGERCGTSKLTAKQVQAIRADARRNAAVAHDYDLTPQYVGAIRARKTWNHI